MTRVFIDTELWNYAIKKPKDNVDSVAKNRYLLASSFLKERFKKDHIYISNHQIAEMFHVFSFRGSRIPIVTTRTYLENLGNMENITVIEVDALHIKNAMKLSQESGVHIWDFLCILPVLDHVEIIYTCDSHFQSRTFEDFGKPIENPLGDWLQA